MSKMIRNGSISYSQIKNDIDTYLKTLSNWPEIKNAIPSSNLTLLEDLLAGFGSYLIFNNYQLRNETYLSTAKLATSVYAIARTFGYIIKRYTAPAIKVRYDGIPTKVLTSGDILGTYNDYDIIYYGETKAIEKLDEIDLVIGKYTTLTGTIDFSNNTLTFYIEPVSLKAIDNNMLEVIYNQIKLPLTRNIEEYVINNKLIDFSDDPYSTTIMVTDKRYNYGYTSLLANSELQFNFIETDGEMNSINLDDCDFELSGDIFTPLEVSSYGSSGETLDDIRRLVPLYYSTQRRMVTQADHQYIVESHELIKSAYVERDDGINQLSTIYVSASIATGDLVDFQINNTRYTWNIHSETLADIVQEISNKIKYDPIISVVSVDTKDLYITTKDPKFLDDWTFYTDNLSRVITQEGETPLCCTVNIYYIKYNTTDDPIALTYYEQRSVANYLKQYKLVGTRFILIPAERITSQINIDVAITKSQYESEVRSQIESIISSYELKLGTEFIFKEFMTQVSQIQVTDTENNELKNPVISVYPNDAIWDKLGIGSNHNISDLDIVRDNIRYIKFESITINFV